MDFITSWFTEKVETSLAQFADELIESIGNRISSLINAVVDGLTQALIRVHTPGYDGWDKYLSPDVRLAIASGCQYFGACLAIILLLIYIIQYMINPRTQRITPLGTLGRLGFAAVIIVSSESISKVFVDTFASLQAIIFSNSAGLLQFDFQKMIVGTFTGNSVAFLGVSIPLLLTPPFSALAIIIAICVSWSVIKQFFRFLIEMVERYLISCILLMFAPAVAPLMILQDTESVFKSYLRMVFGQMFLLCMSSVFIKGAVILLLSPTWCTSILGYFFMIGYLRVMQRIDAYMQAMGLNIAQSGGGILSSLGDAARGISNGFRRADSMRRSAGEVMKAVGVQSGNQGLFAAGSMLGSNASSVGRNGLPTDDNLNRGFAKAVGERGDKISMNGSDSAGIMSEYMNNPNLANKNAVSALSDDSLCQGVEYMTGQQGVDNVAVNRDGSVSFDAEGESGEPTRFNMSMENDGYSTALSNSETGEPTGLYLNSANSLEDNQSYTSNNPNEILEAAGVMGMRDNTDIPDSRIGSIRSATQRGAATVFEDADNNVVAVSTKNGGIIQPSPLTSINSDGNPYVPDTVKDSIRKDINDNYTSKGYKVRSDNNGYADIRFDNTSRQVYFEAKHNSDANWHKVYVQDYGAKDTSMPKGVSSVKPVKRSSNGGLHRTRRFYAIDNLSEKTMKQ